MLRPDKLVMFSDTFPRTSGSNIKRKIQVCTFFFLKLYLKN